MDFSKLMESLEANADMSEEEKTKKMDIFVAKYQKDLAQKKGGKISSKLSCETLKETWLNFLYCKEEQDARIEELAKKMSEIEGAIERVEKFCGKHQLLWKVKNFGSLMSEAREGTRTVVQSPVFDSHRNGYKLQLSLCPVGEGKAQHEAMSLYFTILKGNADSFLLWPFQCPIKFTLINQKKFLAHKSKQDASEDDEANEKLKLSQSRREDLSMVFNPRSHPTNEAFLQRPTEDRNRSLGFQKFILLSDLMEGGYLDNDTIFIQVDVDLSGV